MVIIFKLKIEINTIISFPDIFDLIKRNETSKFYKSIRHHPEYVNYKDEFGNTPLMTSCVLGKNQYVSALLRFKSDPLITNRVGKLLKIHI